MPKAGRPEFNHADDKRYFEAWKRRAVEYLSIRPSTECDWLAIAQHHGLATRLLDWSVNPLNAAFFAVRENHAGPGIIYAAKFSEKLDAPPSNPMKVNSVSVFFPSGVVPRITRQWGAFSIHPKPPIALDDSKGAVKALERLVIEEGYRTKLMAQLNYYGIHPASMFPDLDGVSAHVNWGVQSKEYWFPQTPAPVR